MQTINDGNSLSAVQSIKNIEQLVSTLNLQSKIKFTGEIIMKMLQNKCSRLMLLLCSVSMKIFPVLLLRLCVAGFPVVASNVGGIAEAD